jgi:hypothetical protein
VETGDQGICLLQLGLALPPCIDCESQKDADDNRRAFGDYSQPGDITILLHIERSTRSCG